MLLLLPVRLTASDDRPDGNWWNEQTASVKLNYATGFFDGMELGHDFSYWKFANEKDAGACLGKVATSFGEYGEKYLKNVTNGQLVDGLDTFYSDYKNRRILVSKAVWLVVNGIAGKPEKELNLVIENFRKNVDN